MSGQDIRTSFDQLLSALADIFEQEGREGGSLAATALRDSQSKTYRRTVATCDPGPILEVACALPDASQMTTHIIACRPMIDWANWEGEGLHKEISSRLFTTELVGLDGHIPAEQVRVGLLVSDIDTDYPISSHSGEETYLVLAGLADWTVGGTPYVTKPPGTLIHHPAWVPHGRRTNDQPFLGAWRWSGDLDVSSFSVAEVS
ncbi:MAG: dimethylsulfonioproprionate lyase family protein [Geminicoccaceae bacterium]